MLYKFSCNGTSTLYLCAFSRQIPLLPFLMAQCTRTNFHNAKPLVKLIVWFNVFQKLNIILNYIAFAIFFHTYLVPFIESENGRRDCAPFLGKHRYFNSCFARVLRRTNLHTANLLVKIMVWFNVIQKRNIILNYNAFAIFFHILYVYKPFKFHFNTFFTTLLTSTLLPN